MTEQGSSIDEVIVAVPAHDEEQSIPDCIRSIDVAAGMLQQRFGVAVSLVVAADACTDATVARALSTPLEAIRRCDVISGVWHSAGAARSAAVAVGIANTRVPLDRVWIANTDADCAVSDDWLVSQLILAETHKAVAGIVDLDPCTTPALLIDLFRAAYVLDGDSHLHVHAANLGLRADVYAEVGGWCPNTCVGEDHGLWRRLSSAGHAVVHATATAVMTSGRTTSRVEGGFATGLRLLTEGAVHG